MDKNILRHLEYELNYAEDRHSNQTGFLDEWLSVIKEKAEKCLKETELKERSFSGIGYSGCGFNGDEERFSVLFACMAIAYRGIKEHFNRHYMRRLEGLKTKDIDLKTIDEIELKIWELENLKRQKEMEECEE